MRLTRIVCASLALLCSAESASVAFMGLLLGGIGPAHAALTDAQKCASAKLKAAGKFSDCRAKAMAVAVKTSTTPDYAKCGENLQAAYDKANMRYGASCAPENSAIFLGSVLGEEITNLGCNVASPLSGTPGSVLIFDVPDSGALTNAKLYIKNTSNMIVHASCFSTNTGDRCSDSASPCSGDGECAPSGTCVAGCNVGNAFDLTLFAQGQLYWYPSSGTGGVPAFPASSGQIVCVQVAIDGSPVSANSLLGGLAVGDACPTTTAIAVVGDQGLSNGDFTLSFGPSGDEYESCPASIDPSLMEGCWSQSEFTFICN